MKTRGVVVHVLAAEVGDGSWGQRSVVERVLARGGESREPGEGPRARCRSASRSGRGSRGSVPRSPAHRPVPASCNKRRMSFRNGDGQQKVQKMLDLLKIVFFFL